MSTDLQTEANRRARNEIARCEQLHKFGGVLIQPGVIPVPTWDEAYAVALKIETEDARSRLETAALRKAFNELPLREQLIRSLELELDIASNGLGMPLDHDKIERLRKAVDEARSVEPLIREAAE